MKKDNRILEVNFENRSILLKKINLRTIAPGHHTAYAQTVTAII